MQNIGVKDAYFNNIISFCLKEYFTYIRNKNILLLKLQVVKVFFIKLNRGQHLCIAFLHYLFHCNTTNGTLK